MVCFWDLSEKWFTFWFAEDRGGTISVHWKIVRWVALRVVWPPLWTQRGWSLPDGHRRERRLSILRLNWGIFLFLSHLPILSKLPSLPWARHPGWAARIPSDPYLYSNWARYPRRHRHRAMGLPRVILFDWPYFFSWIWWNVQLFLVWDFFSCGRSGWNPIWRGCWQRAATFPFGRKIENNGEISFSLISWIFI